MDLDYSKVLDIAEELGEYAEMECTGHSDTVKLVCELSRMSYMGDDLENAVVKWMQEELENYKTNAEIVETKQERTIIENLVELRWNNQ